MKLFAKGHLHIELKLNFLRNHLTFESQILYVVSLGMGNETLYSWSHDQDSRNADIWKNH